MELSVIDRLLLLSVLQPSEADLITLRIVRKLREELSFSEEELAVLNFRQEVNQTLWESGGDIPKEVEIGPKATRIVVDALKGLDQAKRLRMEHLGLCDKFGVEPEPEPEEPKVDA